MDDLDIENRELCPDGCCVGVIGADGRCGTCGLGREGIPQVSPERVTEGDEADLDPELRVPCPDESCVGIIGAEGRCGTCGRSG